MSRVHLSRAYSKYGADMGRADFCNLDDDAVLGKFELARVYLDSGGYDGGGAYWGHGAPLYRARAFAGGGGMVEFFLRAESRVAAKTIVTKRHPGAKFRR